MSQLVGYKLIDSNGSVIEQWGGTWGQCPGVPNPIYLPNGNHIFSAEVGVDYDGFTLVDWMFSDAECLQAERENMACTPFQGRIALSEANLLSVVELAVTSADEKTKVAWEYATEWRRLSPMIVNLASALSLTDAQVDALFTEAAKVTA